MKKYEFIEHTADIAIKAYGENLEIAFAVSADALFDIITDSSPITALRKIDFKIHADDRQSLLVLFLSHLLALHEIENIVLSNFWVKFENEYSLKATASGEKFDPQKHACGHHVKGVSYHMMEIIDKKDNNPASVQVLFDV